MRRILATLQVLSLAGLAAACLGSAAPATTHHTTAPIAPAPPATRVVVRYTTGAFARTRVRVRTPCPARARCRVVRIAHASPRLWVLDVTRVLTCDPAGGSYSNPIAACRALRDFARRYHHGGGNACACAFQLVGTAATAVGDIAHVETTLPIDSCTACGLGPHAGRDVQILTPG